MSLRGYIYSQGPKDEKGVRHGAPWGVVVELGEQEAHVCRKCIGGRGAPVDQGGCTVGTAVTHPWGRPK